jgi:hypothetical protein
MSSQFVVEGPSRLPSPSISRSLPALDGPLGFRCAEIRDLLAAATRHDVLTRHRVGALIAETKRAEHTYGTGALRILADALGWDETTLYRYAIVAECWTEGELTEILSRSPPDRPLVTWSHLVVISSCASAFAGRHCLCARRRWSCAS